MPPNYSPLLPRITQHFTSKIIFHLNQTFYKHEVAIYDLYTSNGNISNQQASISIRSQTIMSDFVERKETSMYVHKTTHEQTPILSPITSIVIFFKFFVHILKINMNI